MSALKFNEPLVFYVFRVVVGRAYVMTARELQEDPENSGMNIKDKLAGGKYHSIYISEEQKQSENGGSTDYVSHLYRIFDKSHCRLMYKVSCRVRIMPTVKNNNLLEEIQCEHCKMKEPRQNNPVTLYCVNDKAYFCDSCDN